MPSSAKKHTAQRQIIRLLVFLPTLAVIVAAVWVASAAIVENIRFARAADQILRLVAIMHDVASTDKNFATHPGEDILAALAHAGFVNDTITGKVTALENPWDGFVVAATAAPSVIRIETGMPPRDCRRLALFSARNGIDLGLRLMEAREDAGKVWRRIYDRSVNPALPSNQTVEANCGQAPQVTLALVFALR